MRVQRTTNIITGVNELVYLTDLAYIYHIVNNGVIIYVGGTTNPRSRFVAHKSRFGDSIKMVPVKCCSINFMIHEEQKEILRQFHNGCPLHNSILITTTTGFRCVEKVLIPNLNLSLVNWTNQQKQLKEFTNGN